MERFERGHTPPILTLLEIYEEHPQAVEYDWRTRFATAWSDVPSDMDWGEAWRLLNVVVTDPDTHVAAAIAGWDYPLSREGIAARDLYDLQHQIAWAQGGGKGSKPKPYPRPWPDRTKTRSVPHKDLTQAEIIAALRMAGHTASLPEDERTNAPRPRDSQGRFVAKS